MSESVRHIPAFVEAQDFSALRRREAVARPTAREWARHAALFALAWLTCCIAGIVMATPLDAIREPALADPTSWLGYFVYVPLYYAHSVADTVAYAFARPDVLTQGATFATILLSILLAHEAGHYVACRRYNVRATLPFFLPAPPLFLPGTFGAFIKIKSPIPTRRALFDIGIAGPLAGFIVALPVAVVAVLTTTPAPPLDTSGGLTLVFNDSSLMNLLAHAFGADISHAANNPFHFAAWVGLLVTSLNLLPVGQLDGGHISYALFGERAHRLIGRAAFVVMASLAVLGLLWHNTPGGFVYALLLFVMLRVRHPRAERDDGAPIGRTRAIVAAVTLVIFILCFVPFPITIK